jgi:hypothetical protein
MLEKSVMMVTTSTPISAQTIALSIYAGIIELILEKIVILFLGTKPYVIFPRHRQEYDAKFRDVEMDMFNLP